MTSFKELFEAQKKPEVGDYVLWEMATTDGIYQVIGEIVDKRKIKNRWHYDVKRKYIINFYDKPVSSGVKKGLGEIEYDMKPSLFQQIFTPSSLNEYLNNIDKKFIISK